MRVAVITGPDPGHALPAIALCRLFLENGDDTIVFTGSRWLEEAGRAGVPAQLLKGLTPRSVDDDNDWGQRQHGRAAFMATELSADLRTVKPDLVVADVLTAGGGLAAELLGIPWVELSPHPLYLPSKGLPPIGSGLAAGIGVNGRLRDAVLRAAAARSLRKGADQRRRARVGIGLPANDPGPAAHLVATMPALELPRPDWPANAYIVGPLHWEPTDTVLPPPVGSDPLVVVAPSTATIGAVGLLDAALEGLNGAGVRVALSSLDPISKPLPPWVSAGCGRQDVLLRHAAAVVCGGGHGLLSKSLLAGVPSVVVPGGGDQWELANRAARRGCSLIVRKVHPVGVRRAVLRVIGDRRYADAAATAAASSFDVRDPVSVCHSLLG